MDALIEAAALLSGLGGPDNAEGLALHLADTVGAGLAGAARGTAGRAFLPQGGPLDRIARVSATIRSTEVDDIFLEGCITPGSVVVPVALGLIESGLASPEGLGPSLRAGYAAMLGFGLAFDGPQVLYRGVWPTLAVAPLGAAVTAGRALGLGPEQMRHALGIAGACVSGRAGHTAGELASRWLLMGNAVGAGVSAALAARVGYQGDLKVLAPETLAGPLGQAPRYAPLVEMAAHADPLGQVSFKPFCAAKQTIAAIAAFRDLLAGGLIPDAIVSIEVRVPPPYRDMIAARHRAGDDRLGTITDIAYQLALAAHAPERLLDIGRLPAVASGEVASLVAKIRVVADETLGHAYPRLWPASLSVTTASGTVERGLEVAPGDPGSTFSDRHLAAKLEALFGANGVSTSAPDLMAGCARALTDAAAAFEAARLLFGRAETPGS